jgi:hypothetical protein
MPVKIFSGADYIVEKSVNEFIKNLKVVDIKISTHLNKNEKSQVTVLIHYEGAPPGHSAGPGLL